ncbi:MAG: S-methyl-5-thioribose-1-phosphate isomerase [Arenicellales bacterium]|nr:S-methyl-5-thioribose-1-phosphate isomerase [Arenicellales bacterium]
MSDETDHRVKAVVWRNDKLSLLDQRLLPEKELYIEIDSVDQAADAISSMVVRGAPAIGVTAAYAIVLAARSRFMDDPEQWKVLLQEDLDMLAVARPTAVNLRWAISRMHSCIKHITGNPEDVLLTEAKAIHQEDIDANVKMGLLGVQYLEPQSQVLTHCNAGALATGGYGTALGVVRAGYRAGKIQNVYADETRPWLQGARLTAWELAKEGIPVTLIPDSAAAYLMKQKHFDWVIVGADRIAVNGDVANKIGTYSLAVNARHHGVRFMVVAPTSTVDMEMRSGAEIPIETRDESEVLTMAGRNLSPAGVTALNPVFDVTPAELVDVIVTEKGVVERPQTGSLTKLFEP